VGTIQHQPKSTLSRFVGTPADGVSAALSSLHWKNNSRQTESVSCKSRRLVLRILTPCSRTRSFYAAMGFLPLEETTAFWGEDQPCLAMVKVLASS